MSKLSKEQFEAYLQQIRELAEGPFEEMQPEIEVTKLEDGEVVEFTSRSSKSCVSRKSSPAAPAACACTCTTLPT